MKKREFIYLYAELVLTHFNLLERKMVGETTNMLDVVTALQLADKVVNV